MNKIRNVGIIGGGASGLLAGIFAAKTAESLEKKVNITVYEANSRVGKKILVTGNGRCNLTNMNMSGCFYYGSKKLFESVYQQFDNKQLIRFFEQLGLASKTDFAGRVYPLSNQAAGVLDVLRYEAQRLGVKFVTDTKITSLQCTQDGFLLNKKYFADKCIVAAGGKACPVHGSDGSGFDLLKSIGVNINGTFPALTAIEIGGFTKSLKGIRAEGAICVKVNGKVLAQAKGELQYTDYGISGIPAMQVSRFVSEQIICNGAGEVAVYVDSVPAMSEDSLKKFLLNIINNNPSLPCEMLLAGLMPKRLGSFLLSEVSINPQKELSAVHPAVVDKIVSVIKNKKYKATGVKGFNDAQVTAGGVAEDEINCLTLELKKYSGLYVCGEIVDVDGDCGGYNLQWAFSGGYVAGVNAVREI